MCSANNSDLLLFMCAPPKTSFLLSCQFQAINWPLTWNTVRATRVCLKRQAFHTHTYTVSPIVCAQLRLHHYIPCKAAHIWMEKTIIYYTILRLYPAQVYDWLIIYLFVKVRVDIVAKLIGTFYSILIVSEMIMYLK